MNAEIISVGTELLLGEILNSDAKFLAEELSELGINVLAYSKAIGGIEINYDNFDSERAKKFTFFTIFAPSKSVFYESLQIWRCFGASRRGCKKPPQHCS